MACRRPSRVSAANLVEDASLSPKGERVVFAARGDIFSAPVEKGPTRNLTKTSGAHEKWPRWSPDGCEGRFHLRQDRRRGDLDRSRRTGQSLPEQLTSGRQGDALRARMVGRREADRVQRQGRRAVSW